MYCSIAAKAVLYRAPVVMPVVALADDRPGLFQVLWYGPV